jgi:hypothetical protein
MKYLMMVIVVLGLSVGCATNKGMSSKERDEAYVDYINKQNLVGQDKIRAFNFNGWRALSDRYLIISSSVSKKYLIEVNGFCLNLRHAQTIAIHQGMSASLVTRFDSISVLESAGSKCFIKSIYKVTKEQAKEISALGEIENEQSTTEK